MLENASAINTAWLAIKFTANKSCLTLFSHARSLSALDYSICVIKIEIFLLSFCSSEKTRNFHARMALFMLWAKRHPTKFYSNFLSSIYCWKYHRRSTEIDNNFWLRVSFGYENVPWKNYLYVIIALLTHDPVSNKNYF